MKFLTLRNYMLLLATVPLVLVALAITGFIVPRYIEDMRNSHQSRSAALADQLQQAAGFALFSGDSEQLQRLAAGLLKADPMVSGVWIRDADSRLVGHAEAPRVAAGGDSNIELRWFSFSVLPAAVGNQALLSEFDQVLPLKSQPRPTLALGQIDIQYNDAPFRQAYQRMLFVGGIAVLIAVLMGCGLAMVLVQRISVPLLMVSETVRRIGDGQLDARAMPAAIGVLDSLVSGVNAMAQSLESMQDVLRWRIAEATAELRGQKEAAERVTREKTRFLAAASHDLRQPLQALGLFVHRLSRVSSGTERRRLEQRIAESVAALQTLFGSLLDLSSLETQTIIVNPGHFAAAQMLQPAIERCRALAEQKGLTLRLRGGQHWLYADAALVERVVMNLLGNAIKYTEHGGVLVACRRRGNNVRLEVRDSGIGIAADRQLDIFKEFVQIGNAERDSAKGLGIGLSICRALAGAMGTTIGVRSGIGRGSVFWIELPRGEAFESANNGEIDEVSAAGDAVYNAVPLVLLLEHECAPCAALASQVEAWGFEMAWVRDLTAAQQALPSVPRPAAILCCERMITGDGGEALKVFVATWAESGLTRPFLIVLGEGTSDVLPAPPWAALVDARLSAAAPPGRLRATLNQLLHTAAPG